MNADMKWLDDPEVFRVNQLDAHSDHCYYIDRLCRYGKIGESIDAVIKWTMGVCF